MSIPAIPPIPAVDLPVLDPPADYRGQVRHTLALAADLITAHGWSRGDWVDGAGRLCLAGAINQVVTGDVHVAAWGDGPKGILLAATKGALAWRITMLFGWNHLTYGTYHHGYDGPITKWNDAVCADAASALAMLMAVTDEDIDAAIAAAHAPLVPEAPDAHLGAFNAPFIKAQQQIQQQIEQYVWQAPMVTFTIPTLYPTQVEADTVTSMFKSLTFA